LGSLSAARLANKSKELPKIDAAKPRIRCFFYAASFALISRSISKS
jgi:hypothetical protein